MILFTIVNFLVYKIDLKDQNLSIQQRGQEVFYFLSQQSKIWLDILPLRRVHLAEWVWASNSLNWVAKYI